MYFRLIFSCSFDFSIGVVGTIGVVEIVDMVTGDIVVTVGEDGVPIGVMSGRVGRGGKKESAQRHPVEREVHSSEN